jgi:hypothetical protein
MGVALSSNAILLKCISKMAILSRAWWHTPIIPALRGLRQEDLEFEARLGYTVRFPSPKKGKDNFVLCEFALY